MVGGSETQTGRTGIQPLIHVDGRLLLRRLGQGLSIAATRIRVRARLCQYGKFDIRSSRHGIAIGIVFTFAGYFSRTAATGFASGLFHEIMEDRGRTRD